MEIEQVEKRKVEVEIQGKKEIKMEIEREGSNSLQFNWFDQNSLVIGLYYRSL